MSNASKINTVDESELEKFAHHANDWWQVDGPLKTLHDINPARLDWIKQFIDPSEKYILDIGCGGGILSEGLAKLGAHVTGLDAEPCAIAAAKQHANQEGLNIEYVCEVLESYHPPILFDGITCLEMLEHVEHPESIILMASKLLNPGGFLFLSTINRTLKAYLTAIIGAEYILSILPKQTHTFERFIKPHELAHYVRQSGLQVGATTGLTYHPFSRTAYLEPQKLDVNYLMMAKR